MSYRITKKQKRYLFWKRTIDIIGSFFGILVCLVFLWWWVFIINCFVTKGHPLFISERVGKNGRLFKLIKFRSMRYGVDEKLAAVDAKPRDMATDFGWFMRIKSIDETPQLLNIFVGNMSFIGPRPLIDNATDHITIALRNENGASAIRPGLSGYAQVNGRAKMMPDKKGEMDGYYVQHMSFRFDVKLFFATFINIDGSKIR